MAMIFPKWTNEIPKVAPPVLGIVGAFATFVVWYWFSPYHTDVGYQPTQPIAYSHKLHAGNMGMDCRYCHTNVEISPYAGVPPTQTCLNCHNLVRAGAPAFAQLRASKNEDGTINPEAKSIEWRRIHKIADYAYFDHSAHVTVGVGCKSCHGRVDQMPVVQQVEPLSMGWCLECHRNIRNYEERGFEPADVLRPIPEVSITDMTWDSKHPSYAGWKENARAKAKTLKPPTVECSGCHR